MFQLNKNKQNNPPFVNELEQNQFDNNISNNNKQNKDHQNFKDYIFKKYIDEKNNNLSQISTEKYSKHRLTNQYDQYKKNKKNLEQYKKQPNKENKLLQIIDFIIDEGNEQKNNCNSQIIGQIKQNDKQSDLLPMKIFDFQQQEQQQEEKNDKQEKQQEKQQEKKPQDIKIKYQTISKRRKSNKRQSRTDKTNPNQTKIQQHTFLKQNKLKQKIIGFSTSSPVYKKINESSEASSIIQAQSPCISIRNNKNCFKSLNHSRLSIGKSMDEKFETQFIQKQKKHKTKIDFSKFPKGIFLMDQTSKKAPLEQEVNLSIKCMQSYHQNLRQFEEEPDDEYGLKGVKIHTSSLSEGIEIEFIDKQLFVSSQIPPGIILKCKLKRSTGWFSAISPVFDLYLQNGLKHILSAKSNTFRNREVFQISTNVQDFKSPIRSLMANVRHNQYWLLNEPLSMKNHKISKLDLAIQYKQLQIIKKSKQSQQIPSKQRQIRVICRSLIQSYSIGMDYNSPQINFQWLQKYSKLNIHNIRNVSKLERKQNFSEYQSAQQNSQYSNKNMFLIDSEDDQQQQETIPRAFDEKTQYLQQSAQKANLNFFINDDIEKNQQNEPYYYLQMNKESENVFDIEIQHPLTPLQAMAIILTRFDVQLK